MKIRVEVSKGMRLYNTYYICKQCRDIIKELDYSMTLKASLTEKGVVEECYIESWETYKEALFSIKQIEILSDDVEQFYETVPVFVREKRRPQIDGETKEKLENIKNRMVRTMDVIIELYENINDSGNDSGDEKGIDVKIPSCDSLGEYISYLKEIDFIFLQCPFLQHKAGTVKFKTVDIGSQWISFVIAATAGTAAVTYILKNLALLVDKAIQIRSHLKNIEQQEEVLRSKKLQNNVLESSLEGFKVLKNYYFDEALKAIEAENGDTPLKDGEERGKVEKSLEKLVGLMDKGVEIYASINTDNDIQVLFPALEDKIELPDSIIKYIEDKQKPENE